MGKFLFSIHVVHYTRTSTFSYRFRRKQAQLPHNDLRLKKKIKDNGISLFIDAMAALLTWLAISIIWLGKQTAHVLKIEKKISIFSLKSLKTLLMLTDYNIVKSTCI